MAGKRSQKGVVLLAAFVLSCPGTTGTRGDGAADGFGPANCSPTGKPAWCNPIQDTGCVGGHCYVIKDQGTSCVCPQGSAGTGESCNTTTECVAGHVCAGTQPPGVCRANCDPKIPDCPAGMKCTPIQYYWDYGFCEPE